jgi:hypothetical protein
MDADKQELNPPQVLDLHDETAPEEIQSLTIARSLEPGAYGLDLSKIAV